MTAERACPHFNHKAGKSMVDSSDQRDFHRMTVACSIRFRKTDEEDFRTGTANNISAGGVQFSCGEPFSPGDTVEVMIEPGVALTPPLHARVEVVRCDESGQQPGDYDVACRIRQILD